MLLSFSSFNEVYCTSLFPRYFKILNFSFQFPWKPLDVLEPDILNDLDDDTCADLRGKLPLEFCHVLIFLSCLYFRSCGAFSELLLLDSIMTNSVFDVLHRYGC